MWRREETSCRALPCSFWSLFRLCGWRSSISTSVRLPSSSDFLRRLARCFSLRWGTSCSRTLPRRLGRSYCRLCRFLAAADQSDTYVRSEVQAFRFRGNELRYIFLGISLVLLGLYQVRALPFIILAYILVSIVRFLIRRGKSPKISASSSVCCICNIFATFAVTL